mmetsp:Transcript_17678/g.43082  ORF Transcript_17678/g.43082 Transcript_17678/m.43082 type:complete len:363 (+) Transcript_17678:549-1637(+)
MKIYYFALSATAVFFCTATTVSSSSVFDASTAGAEEDSTETKIDTSNGNKSNDQNLSLFYNNNNHHLRNDYQKVLEKFAVQANKDLNNNKKMKNAGGNNGGATRNIIDKEDHYYGHRRLQLTQYEFDNYFCDVFESELGARCTCDSTTMKMTCDLGEECMTYPSTFFPDGTATDCPAGGDDDGNEDGSGGEVCIDTSMTMTLTEEDFTGTLDISYIEVAIVYTGMDYSAERVLMWPSSSNNKCEMYYSIGDLEYKCNSCRMCTGEAVTFDCSNISPDFSAVCINVNNMDAVNDLKFDYCPVGGAPQPTTPSVGPAPQPITVGSGSSSSSSGVTVTSSSSSFDRFIIVPIVVSIVVTAVVAGI